MNKDFGILFKRIVVALFLIISIIGCRDNDELAQSNLTEAPYQLDIPIGFPTPDIPEDNQLTTKRVALGKKLFFDPILSLDSSVSCGSCHFQKNAFSDTVAISTGIHGRNGMRNAPTLMNLVYSNSFFWDAGVPTLEIQVISPIQTEEEMHLNMVDAVNRLKSHPEYPTLIKEAYQREVDVFSITRAIASFERTLISGNSKYDQYEYQQKNNVLTTEELAGKELFFSDKTNCSKCHSGFNFTNQTITSNGLYDNYDSDPGRKRITLKDEDEGKFKVPTLRNIEVSGPYMHDGSFSTLSAVVDHYASGGSQHFNKSNFIQGFEISAQEKEQLIAFLHTLTDPDFLNNPNFIR